MTIALRPEHEAWLVARASVENRDPSELMGEILDAAISEHAERGRALGYIQIAKRLLGRILH